LPPGTAAELGIACMAGFLHVPSRPELVGAPERQPSMAMTLQADGLDCLLKACRLAGDETGLYLKRTA
jgi:pyrrolidone-carboxylate peptidase